MEPLTTAALAASAIEGLSGGIKAIGGYFAARKAERDLQKELSSMPKYTRPEEYEDLLKLYKERAAAQEMPGQSLAEQKLGATTAAGIRQAQKAAPSSVAALGATTSLHEAHMNAIRDLEIQFAQYKANREAELGGVYQQGAQYADQAWQYNQWYPSQVRLNIAGDRLAAARAMMYGGAEQAESGVLRGIGTIAQVKQQQPPPITTQQPSFNPGMSASSGGPTLGVSWPQSSSMPTYGRWYNGQWYPY